MLAKIVQNQKEISKSGIDRSSHVLFIIPAGKSVPKSLPLGETLKGLLTRRHMKFDELSKGPISGDSPHGGLVVWLALDFSKTKFEQLTTIRKAIQVLLGEQPEEIAIAVTGDAAQRAAAAEMAVYVTWINGTSLPTRKKEEKSRPLKTIHVFGHQSGDNFAHAAAQAEGNLLARELTMLPANDLTPGIYRDKVKKMAKENGWKLEEFDMKALRKMGAGAFVAVGQGSIDEDAAIVHLKYSPKGAKKNIALVGKGICFDTGGHNLKPARYMHGMHEDMNGSAVALGILLAATRLKLPIVIDAWLALAQNHISPKAYKQNDVVTALNGTTIEIIHTDAEGRMVLADTLTMASRKKPDAVIDFATLTGSMVSAVGSRYSGIFSNQDDLLEKAIDSGKASGERVCAFPLDADYEPALDSKIADIKQCTMEGAADHILAARFLMRFLEKDTHWLHMDLSACNNEGGLGAVAGNVTGFGVGWGVAMIEKLI